MLTAHVRAARALLVLALLQTGAATGCRNDVTTPTLETGDGVQRGSVIVGAVDWVDVVTLPAASLEARRARAVGLLWLPAASARCTGFLVADDVVMTNFHCVPTAADAEGATMTFGVLTATAPGVEYACGALLANDPVLDFALLRCDGHPGATRGVLPVIAPRPEDVVAATRVDAVHQNCDWHADPECRPTEKLSRGQVLGMSGADYTHDADTLPGSSGSPLLDEATGAVLGLHHAGIGGDDLGRGSYNLAVPLRSIVRALQRRRPDLGLFTDVALPGLRADLAEDPHEPDDDRASAKPLAMPGPTRRDDGTLTEGDLDVLAVLVTEPGLFSATATFDAAELDLDLALTDLAGHVLASARGVTSTEALSALLPVGSYLLLVVPYRGTGRYAVEGQLAPRDILEPNDVAAAATPIPATAWVALGARVAPAADVDWFRLAPGRRVHVELDAPAAVTLDVVDAAGRPLLLPPIARFVGGPCADEGACSFTDGACRGEDEGWPGGMCTMSCTRLCPDQAGAAATFCVDDTAPGAPGMCVSRCDDGLFPEGGCRAGYRCASTARVGEPDVLRPVCLPDEDGIAPLAPGHVRTRLDLELGTAPAFLRVRGDGAGEASYRLAVDEAAP